MNDATSDQVIILVHGTFGRNADWISSKHYLTTSLKQSFDGEVLPFDWSGRNSHQARVQAGAELALFVRKIIDSGIRRIHIISHSHGGNVVLYALNDELIQTYIFSIAFLATPFLIIKRRPVENFSNVITQTLSWLVVFPLFMPFGGLMLIDVSYRIFGAIGGGLMFLVGSPAILSIYLWYRSRARKICHLAFTGYLRRQQDKTRSWLIQASPKCRTFIATVKRDEAAYFLRSIDLLSVAPWYSYEFTSKILGSVILSFIASFVSTSFIFGDTVSELKSGHIAMMITFFLVAATVTVPVLSVVASVLLRGAGFGYEGIVGGATLRILPSILPTWHIKSAYNQHLETDLSGRNRHSMIHDDRPLLVRLIQWISQEPSGILENPSQATKRSGTSHKNLIWSSISACVICAITLCETFYDVRKANVVIRNRTAFIPHFYTETQHKLLDIDVEVPDTKSFMGINNKPLIISTDKIVKPADRCFLDAIIKFSNYGTSISIELHRLKRVSGQENIMRSDLSFQDETYESILYWNSAEGTTLDFGREFVSSMKEDSTIILRVWNSGSETELKGDLRIACSPKSNTK